MHQLNDMGKLADLAADQPDSLTIVLDGASSGGFPPTLVSEMTGMPILTDQPHPDTQATSPGQVFLFNPRENDLPVRYLLNDRHEFTMEPGERQSLGSNYTIAFDSGSAGTKRYSLSGGGYQWVQTTSGWDLNRTGFDLTIDNCTSPNSDSRILRL